LYDPAVVTPAVELRAWQPPIPGVREVLHARFVEHAYPRHAHDTWTLFIVDDGGVRYDLGRHQRLAAPSMVSILPPHLAHDGRPATGDGYRMRVLYVDESIVPDGMIGAAVDRPFVQDVALRRAIHAVHVALDSPDGPLEAETRLHAAAQRLVEALGGIQPDDAPGWHTSDLAEAVRAGLDARLFERPSIAQIAAGAQVRPATAARAFRDTFGLPPHAYVLGRRLEAARERILSGQSLADVAAETGFVDQAHLTRRFKRLSGTTPARYRQA
jgi:AraC-like DNA-binding protein